MGFKLGDFVQVCEDALHDPEYGGLNRDVVGKHGYLYFVTDVKERQEYGRDADLYECRSLASGADGISFFGYELRKKGAG
jgi:hypothetical protein